MGLRLEAACTSGISVSSTAFSCMAESAGSTQRNSVRHGIELLVIEPGLRHHVSAQRDRLLVCEPRLQGDVAEPGTIRLPAMNQAQGNISVPGPVFTCLSVNSASRRPISARNVTHCLSVSHAPGDISVPGTVFHCLAADTCFGRPIKDWCGLQLLVSDTCLQTDENLNRLTAPARVLCGRIRKRGGRGGVPAEKASLARPNSDFGRGGRSIHCSAASAALGQHIKTC